MAFPTTRWRLPRITASAMRSARARLCPSFIARLSTPGANCFFCPTTPQIVFGYLPEFSRFITTVPTASMPSSLERLNSKYITRAMQLRSLELPPRRLPPHPGQQADERDREDAEGERWRNWNA